MAKRARATTLPRSRPQPAAAPPAAFPFRLQTPKGGELSEEADLYTRGSVDPTTGRRILPQAQAAARMRMNASVMARRQRKARGDDDEAEYDLDALGEGADEEPEAPEDDEEGEAPAEEPEAPEDEPRPGATPVVSTPFVKGFYEAVKAVTPAPSPVPPVPEAAPGLAVRIITVEDIDRWWDWLRADGDMGAAFFTRPIRNSLDLHQRVGGFLGSRTSLLRALYYEGERGVLDQHLGFVALSPILHDPERTAAFHLYLRADIRARLATILPPVLTLVAEFVPGYTLAVLTSDPVQQRLYRQALTQGPAPTGFVEHSVFVR